MLNENQLAAVEFKDGPCLCLAGPGSGKTTVLVERILSLINSGVDPECILVITFTKDAAKEMKDRFLKKASPNTYNVTFGTFHSVFFQILKRSEKYQEFTLLNDYQKSNLLFECQKIKSKKDVSKDYIQSLEKDISLYYNTENIDFLGEDKEKQEEFFSFLKLYRKRKTESKVFDFDDLLVLTKELLTKDMKVRKYWQKRFSYFLVDEFQDINDVQFFVLKLLVENNPIGSENIFVVGDDDQSIYGFRGANPKVMLNFPEEFKDTTTIFLDKNYRSCKDLVMSSKKLVDVNKSRFYKDYKAFNENPGKIECMHFKDEFEEGEIVSKLLMEESKTKKTIGILYRQRSRKTILYNFSKMHNLNVFCDDLVPDFTGGKVALDIISFMKLSINQYKRKDILMVMNKPCRNLNRGGLFKENVKLNEWRDYYPEKSASYQKIKDFMEKLKVLEGLSPFLSINYILKGLGYEDYLMSIKEESKEEYEKLISDLVLLTAYSKDFSDKASFIKDLLRERKEVQRKRKDERISFYTFHGSKGLEFDKVYILDAVEGITPSKNAKSEELLEEERRMFYVAMTRAKEEIVFCVPKKISEEEVNPSRFLMESGWDMV